MALAITEFLRAINPNIGLVVNADGKSFRIGVEDINSDEILAAIVAGNVDLAALEVINAAIQVAVEASQVDLAAIEVINTAIQAATEAVETVSGAQADAIVAAGAVGSSSAKLRRVTQGLEDLLAGIVLAAGTNQIGARSKCALLNSGVKTGDAQIKASAGEVYWISVSDTAALAIELNDHPSGSGTDLWAIDIPADGYGIFIFDPPIEFSAGIYLDVSTVTCKVTIGYK